MNATLKVAFRFTSLFGAIFISIMLFSQPVRAQDSLQSNLESITQKPVYQTAIWGWLFVDMDSGRVVSEKMAEKLFTPGSTIKLFSAASALEVLGPDYSSRTPIYYRGRIGPQGVLSGDLILVAGGDLTLGGRMGENGAIEYTAMDHNHAGLGRAELTPGNPLAGLKEISRLVKASGISAISGEVLIDDRLFETTPSEPGSGYIQTPIIINDNLIDITISPTEAGRAARVKWRPDSSALIVDANVITGPADSKPDLKLQTQDRNKLVIRGSVPAGSLPQVLVHQVRDPASWARSLLIDSLTKAGIRVQASALTQNPRQLLPIGRVYQPDNLLAAYLSPPLPDHLKLILKVSHNQGADLLPLLMALKNGGRTMEEGLGVMRRALEELGVPVEKISISDGAGAAGADLLSPRVTVDLLLKMSGRPPFKAFHQALPILGTDGTLAHTLADSTVKGKIRAKTGTIIELDIVNQRPFLKAKGLAGYMTTVQKKRLAFAVFMNNMPMEDLDQMMDAGRDLAKITEAVYSTH